jgi:hypothetical protein
MQPGTVQWRLEGMMLRRSIAGLLLVTLITVGCNGSGSVGLDRKSVGRERV